MIRSTVKLSTPIIFPDNEDVYANGFAWSHDYGVIHQSAAYTTLSNGGSQWLGTQS